MEVDNSTSQDNFDENYDNNPYYSSEKEETRTNSIVERLAHWKFLFHIPLMALTYLLSILRLFGHEKELPKDARTVLGTPRGTSYKIIRMGHGKYIHLGVRYGIENFIKKKNCDLHL